MFDDDLVVAAALVEAHLAAQDHFGAVGGLQFAEAVAVDEHGAAHLGAVVLEGEVPVPGAGPPVIADLAAHPHLAEAAFERQPRLPVERADR